MASPRKVTSRLPSTSSWRCNEHVRNRRGDGRTEETPPRRTRRTTTFPIPLNQRVLSYIELFQGRLHDFIEQGMQRGSKYLPMIQNVFRAEGLPLDLAYVPLVESAFKPNALSRVKAKGVWQFMTGTAHRERPAPRLVHRRAVRTRKRPRSRPPNTSARSARSSTATGTWRSRPTTAARAACSVRSSRRRLDRLLEAGGKAQGAAARNARIRADDSRGDRHRAEPGAMRLRHSSPSRSRSSTR